MGLDIKGMKERAALAISCRDYSVEDLQWYVLFHAAHVRATLDILQEQAPGNAALTREVIQEALGLLDARSFARGL